MRPDHAHQAHSWLGHVSKAGWQLILFRSRSSSLPYTGLAMHFHCMSLLR